MAKKQCGWVYSPKSVPKPKVPDDLVAEVQAKADELIEDFSKPNFVKKPPKKWRWNYIIAIHSKWHRSFFYFIATFRSPHGITPTFESPFTRLEYIGKRRFNLAYLRHTGKWQEVFAGLSLDQCSRMMRTDPIFQPPGV